MRTIAIASQKGGVGKTATTCNLGAALAQQGKRVLLVDLDPQANLSTWYGIQDSEGVLLNALAGEDLPQTKLIQQTHIAGVEILPASEWLLRAEDRLGSMAERELLLKRLLGRIGSRWDYLLMDCPPNLGVLTVNALAAASEVLIPVQALAAGIDGLVQLLKSVGVIRERINPDLRLAGILFSEVDTRTLHAREVIQRIRERFGEQVYPTMIRSNIRIAESYSFRQPVLVHDKRSHGAEDFRALALEVIGQENGAS